MGHVILGKITLTFVLKATIDRERTLNKYAIDLKLNQLKTVETMLYLFIKVTNLLTDCNVNNICILQGIQVRGVGKREEKEQTVIFRD